MNNPAPHSPVERPVTRRVGSQRIDALHDCEPTQVYSLLNRLQAMGFGGAGLFQTVGLTSSQRREGVTTVASSLALEAAVSQGLNVLLIDANFDQPGIHRIFQVPKSPGLRDLIHGQAAEENCIHDLSVLPVKSWPPALRNLMRRRLGRSRSRGRNREPFPQLHLSVMSVGSPDRPNQTISNATCEGFFEHACAEFDLIVVDLPNASSTTAGIPLTQLDGVILVLEAESTSDLLAHKSLNLLRSRNANVLGVAFNKCRQHLPGWINRILGD